MNKENTPITEEKLKANPLIIGSLFVGIISILSCFVPIIRMFSLPACIIIAALMAIYSIKKSVNLPFSGWIICIVSALIAVLCMENPAEEPSEDIVVSESQIITNELENIPQSNIVVATNIESNYVDYVTNDIIVKTISQEYVVSSNEVEMVNNREDVFQVDTQNLSIVSVDTNEFINLTNIVENTSISTQNITSVTNSVVEVFIDHKFYMSVLGKLYGLKNNSDDLKVIAEIYINRSKFNNPNMEELFTMFTTVACLRYDREDLYKRYFARTSYARDLEKRLLDTCPKCDGLGVVFEKCKYCGGYIKVKRSDGTYKTVRSQPGKCVSCRGKGVIKTGMKSSVSGQTMGKHAGGIKCSACRGTGLCQHCHGSGDVSVICPECSGRGETLSKTKIKSAYSDLYKLCVTHLDELANQEQR